jgi:hypothetical protein
MAQRPLCRQTPKVGAECPNWACSELSGGRSEMSVPTGITARKRLRYMAKMHFLTLAVVCEGRIASAIFLGTRNVQ